MPPKTRGKFETNCSKKRKKAKRMAKGRRMRRRRREREKQQLSNQNTLATPSRVVTVSLKQQIKQSKCRIHRHTVTYVLIHRLTHTRGTFVHQRCVRATKTNCGIFINVKIGKGKEARGRERERTRGSSIEIPEDTL